MPRATVQKNLIENRTVSPIGKASVPREEGLVLPSVEVAMVSHPARRAAFKIITLLLILKDCVDFVVICL